MTAHFLSLTVTEQAAHLLSIAKPDPARLQREYEAAMLEKAKAKPDALDSLTVKRLARIERCDEAINFTTDHPGEDFYDWQEGSRLAAIVLSRQVAKHLPALVGRADAAE